jgi:hypothetical protein
LSDNELLDFCIIVPMFLEHWCCAPIVVRGVVGLSIRVILRFMCIGLRSALLAISGWCLVVLLRSFPSLASCPICYSPARDIGGLSCVGGVVSCLGDCIGHMIVAISWYSWMIVITWAVA